MVITGGPERSRRKRHGSVMAAWQEEINWELNERISLRSAGSGKTPELKSIDRSEKKREIIPPQGNVHGRDRVSRSEEDRIRGRTRAISREALNTTSTVSRRAEKLNGRSIGNLGNEETATSSQRRWNVAKESLDRTNDAISKRLQLIHELNRKILANYDKFHERSRRSRSSGKAEEPEALYEEIRKEGTKQKFHSLRDPPRRKYDGDYASRVMHKAEVQRHADGDKSDFCQTNRFHREESESNASDEKYAIFRVKDLDGDEVFETGNHKDHHEVNRIENESLESLNQCTLQRGGIARSSFMSKDRYFEPRRVAPPAAPSASLSSATERKTTITERSKVITEERRDSGETRLREKEVLRDFNETIDQFEVDLRSNRSSGKESVKDRRRSKSRSFGGDTSAKDRLQESFDSSWDSGVGVELATCRSIGEDGKGSGKESGWIRIHTGIESTLVYLTLETTANDVCRDMLLADHLSVFVQYGEELGRRLSPREKPLELQEELLLHLGYQETTRRARLGLDSELRRLIAFHVGPAAPLDDLRGYSRCGYALVLKGLVFPQWKRRALAVAGSRLFLYPACSDSRPEWMELAGGGTVCCAPSRLGKLVLRVTGFPARLSSSQQQQQQPLNCQNSPQQTEEDVSTDLHQQRQQQGTATHYRETRHLYLGFQHPWDRDLWHSWLKQATQLPACPSKLDMSKAGLSRIPENIAAFTEVEEFFLGHNRLTEIDGNLELLYRLSRLRELHLESNHLRTIPRELLVLKNLTFLDLSDNEIQEIPPGISSLVNLDELILNRNEIKELPEGIRELRKLQHISLTENLIEIVPSFLLEMRALALTDVVTGKEERGHDNEKNNLQNSLCKVNLRNNQLKGNIILGNYGNLTHLDLSENSIEKLDLSALQDLRSVRCARNILTELTLCGRSLVSLIAGNNKLKKVSVNPEPIHLEHLDISFNELEALPEWIPDLPDLRALFASNNALTALPDRLLSQPSKLEVLHLPHNRLQALPPPRKSLSIVHLTLQDNALTALPRNFFVYTDKLKVLNLSNNRLSELPYTDEIVCPNRTKSRPSMEKLYLTGNSLTNTALDSLMKFTSMKVLHMAYNTLDTLPESCIAAWKKLEEMVLSGNRLQYLPDNVANLPHLRVLRVHSNRLLTCPPFNRTTSLKVLDLAHNQLDRVNLENLVPAQLQFLDISCNTRLHVDPRQFQRYRSQRPVSLIDVSGQNRATLPAHPRQGESKTENSDHLPWRLGFSETAGTKEKLYISQVRMPSFCNSEGLFGIFDGSLNQQAPGSLQEIIPRLLLEERTIKETSAEYLKYTLLSAQKELKEKGQRYGVDATLVHLTKLPESNDDIQEADECKKYLLTVATTGDSKAVLCRATGPLQIAGAKSPQSLQMIRLKNKTQQCNIASSFPYSASETTIEEVILEEDDEFIIVANRRVWEVLSIQEAVREARAEASPVLAAKRLQDLAQAYEAEDNLSILVVRLSSPGLGHVDPVGRMMHELRHAVHLKSTRNQRSSESCSCSCCLPRPAPHEPPAACCCHGQNANDTNTGGNGLYLNGVLKSIISGRSSTSKSNRNTHQVRYYNKPNRLPESTEREVSVIVHRDDRSSPSGQSDQTSEGLFDSKSRRRTSARGRFCSGSTVGSSRSATACKARTMNRGTMGSASGHSGQDASSSSERSTAPSDEQLRCWEYMLEQNTQLLFDKELDTLTTTSRSISSPLRRGQSRSTPQLGSTNAIPFLSKHFGSARSFDPSGSVRVPMGIPMHTIQTVHPVPRSMIRSTFGSGRRPLNGGPNAAYFGSLQRLMPYNLEYDFAVIQERGALDSLEQDTSRMQQYWGVATTEL